MKGNVSLYKRGMEEVLRGEEVKAAVHEAAELIGGVAVSQPSIARHGMEMDVTDYEARGGSLIGTRAASAVNLLHPGALGAQAKWGVLTRAASQSGFEVKHRAPKD